MAEVNEKPGKVITGKVRMSYVHVFEPAAIEGSTDQKYSVCLLIPKTDKVTLGKINQAIEEIKASDAAKATWGGKVPTGPTFKTPLRDGDEERGDKEEYKGMMFVNANCSEKSKPQVVDKKGMPITSPDEFYSGCYGRASVNFYAFNKNGNKGIACGLNNLMKLDDGESLAGRSSASEDFKEFFEGDSMFE